MLKLKSQVINDDVPFTSRVVCKWIPGKLLHMYMTITSIKEYGMQLLVRNSRANVKWMMKEQICCYSDIMITHLPHKIFILSNYSLKNYYRGINFCHITP